MASTERIGASARRKSPALLGSLVAACRSAQDAALPVRRTARGRPRRRLGGLAETAEVARDARGVGDHREQTHAPLASRAREHVEAEGPLQELGPWAVRTTSRHVLDVLHARRACRRRALRRQTRAELACRAEHPRVPHRMETRGRHRGAQAAEQRQRIEVDGDGESGPASGGSNA